MPKLFRRRYRRRVFKKASAKKVAFRALRGVRKLFRQQDLHSHYVAAHCTINDDTKTILPWTFNTPTTGTGTLVLPLTAVPEGDSVTGRQGLYIVPKSLSLRMQIGQLQLSDSKLSSLSAQHIRLILVRHSGYAGWTVPDWTQLLTDPNIPIVSPIIVTLPVGLRVIRDKVITLPGCEYYEDSSSNVILAQQPGRFKKMYIRLRDKKISFSGASETTFNKNHYFLYVISSVPVNGANIGLEFDLTSRFRYNDP